MTADVVYPVYEQAVGSRCNNCWQPGPSAMCADPYGEGLRRLCGRCDESLPSGWAVELTDEQKTEAWLWLARHYINQRAGQNTGVTELHIDWALAALTPAWMPPQVGWARFEGLREDLIAFGKAETGDVDYASLEPDWRDCRGLVDDAVNALIGRRS